MSASQEKRIILITGATNGIGLDTTIYLASASPNHHVIMGARNPTKAEEKIKEIQTKSPSGTLSFVQLDMNDDTSIHAAAKSIQQDFGRLDILINNAGICLDEPGEWPTRDEIRTTFETNVCGPAVLTGALIPLLKASSDPRIINVTSGLGSVTGLSKEPQLPELAQMAHAKWPAYRMSKAALDMLTVYSHFHLREFGFKVWAFCPGFVVTDLGRDREKRENMGIDSSETSAKGILEIVEGKRDAEDGKFIGREGRVYPW